jgi:hypothetical protein
MFKLVLACCVLAAPASAAVVTYTYEGPEMACEDGAGFCPLTTTFSGAHFAVDDADPGFGGGDLVYSLFLGDGYMREFIYHKGSGSVSSRDCDAYIDGSCPTFQRPTFFLDDAMGYLSADDVEHSDDYKIVLLDFDGGELTHWRLTATYQGYWSQLISSAADLCDRGGPIGHFDCINEDYSRHSAEPGTWTRSPPIAPVPLPVPLALLLVGLLAPLALKARSRA